MMSLCFVPKVRPLPFTDNITDRVLGVVILMLATSSANISDLSLKGEVSCKTGGCASYLNWKIMS
jgi:hypothetical protein